MGSSVKLNSTGVETRWGRTEAQATQSDSPRNLTVAARTQDKRCRCPRPTLEDSNVGLPHPRHGLAVMFLRVRGPCRCPLRGSLSPAVRPFRLACVLPESDWSHNSSGSPPSSTIRSPTLHMKGSVNLCCYRSAVGGATDVAADFAQDVWDNWGHTGGTGGRFVPEW